jgi:hypothetical protein
VRDTEYFPSSSALVEVYKEAFNETESNVLEIDDRVGQRAARRGHVAGGERAG